MSGETRQNESAVVRAGTVLTVVGSSDRERKHGRDYLGSERLRLAYQSASPFIIDGQGGQSVGPSTWRIPEGNSSADAFRVIRDGTTVTIVNGPDEPSLTEVAPDVSGTNETASSP